jgi:signal recognition particle receptor subunit beta
MTESFWILIRGMGKVGKTTFLSCIVNQSDQSSPKHNGHALDSYPCLNLGNDDRICFHNPPPTKPFDHMWLISETNIIGFILIIDSTDLSKIQETKGIIQTFVRYAPTAWIVAANKQDLPEAWDVEALRVALRIPKAISVVPCVATNWESVKQVIITLLEETLKRSAAESGEET